MQDAFGILAPLPYNLWQLGAHGIAGLPHLRPYDVLGYQCPINGRFVFSHAGEAHHA
jgi:hypothetical protein